MESRILLLGAGGASLCQLQGRRVVSMTLLGADAAAPGRFLAQLRSAPNLPTTLLLDLVEEEFRPDRLPRLPYRDRRAVLERRLAAQFRDTSRRLQVAGPSRRDVLHAGLGRPERLSPWLAALADADVPLRGIHSLPLVCTGLLRRLGLQRGAWLLLGRTQVGGLRQSFFRDGKLLLSRLVPLAPGFDAGEDGALGEELDQMRRYLARHALVPLETPLPVALLADPALMPLGEVLARDPRIRPLRLFNTLAVAGALGVPDALAAAGMDALAASLVAHRPPAAQYATALELAPFRRALRRTWGARAGLAGLAAAALVGASLTAQGLALARRTDVLAAETARDRQALIELARTLPPALVAPDQMAPLLALASHLAAEKATPEAWLSGLSPHLGHLGGLHWTSLDWQARDPGAPAGTRQGSVAELRGEVKAFSGDYRSALAQVEALATALGAAAGVETVTVLESPLDPGPGGALVGQAAPLDAPPAPRFALAFRWAKELAPAQDAGKLFHDDNREAETRDAR